mmetsp:Transcript_50882/g.93418  ORF Transcript_50882/g.93418 Transcript_50882/m.93418 type:complete len:255 (+) Transcript_50882:227-991(+)
MNMPNTSQPMRDGQSGVTGLKLKLHAVSGSSKSPALLTRSESLPKRPVILLTLVFLCAFTSSSQGCSKWTCRCFLAVSMTTLILASSCPAACSMSSVLRPPGRNIALSNSAIPRKSFLQPLSSSKILNDNLSPTSKSSRIASWCQTGSRFLSTVRVRNVLAGLSTISHTQKGSELVASAFLRPLAPTTVTLIAKSPSWSVRCSGASPPCASCEPLLRSFPMSGAALVSLSGNFATSDSPRTASFGAPESEASLR